MSDLCWTLQNKNNKNFCLVEFSVSIFDPFFTGNIPFFLFSLFPNVCFHSVTKFLLKSPQKVELGSSFPALKFCIRDCFYSLDLHSLFFVFPNPGFRSLRICADLQDFCRSLQICADSKKN